MRQRGNYRLLLNANLWPGINVAMMDGGKGVTFAIVNCAAPSNAVHEVAEGASDPAKLSTYGVRFKVRVSQDPTLAASLLSKFKCIIVFLTGFIFGGEAPASRRFLYINIPRADMYCQQAKDHVTEFCSAVDRHKHGGKSNGKEEEQEAPPPTGEDAT